MVMNGYDLVVIGGGISGLSLARGAAEAGWRTLLLEKDERLGGCVRTVRSPEGFWLELGAHTCYNSYGHLIGLAERLHLRGRVLTRRRVPFRLWDGERAVSIPRALSFTELLANAWRLPFARRSGRAVAEVYAPLFGPGNYARVIGPALDAVICQPAAPFDAESLFRPKPRRKDLPRSFTFAGGLATLVEAMAAGSGLRCETGVEVTALEGDAPWIVVTADGRRIAAARLALAVSPDVAAGLLAALRPALAALLRAIGVVSVTSVALAVPADAVVLPPVAGLIGRDQPFFALVSRDVVPDTRYRGFTCHLRQGYDGAQAPAIVARVLGVARQHLEVVAQGHAILPALRPGHRQRLAAIDAALAGGSLALTGNYFLGMSLEECAARSDGELRRLSAAG